MDIKTLKEKFVEKYGEGDFSGYFSPGRVNLIGEHTDYNGGFVFPCALSFGNYCLIRKVDRPSFRFSSLNMDLEVELSLDQLTTPLENKAWVNYPLGVLAQFVKRGLKPATGADFLFYGDVPNGAGLSSSAALEVVTAVAVNDQYQFGLDRITLVKMGQKAEHEFAGVMCGIMDQFASGMGEKDHAIFLNCDTLDYELVPVVLEGCKIVVSNTNSPHKLDSGKYNERVRECKAAVEALKPYKAINQLADLSLDEFKTLEPKIENEVVRARARHVVSEIERTTDAVKALKAGDLELFGQLMNASHVSLRDDYEVTGPELDAMAEAAWKIDGVIGSRMTGGGFGGCTVSVVKDEAVEPFIDQVGKEYKAKTGLTPAFYVAEIGDGGKKIF
ncbi:MAG: galactokinase [Mangrovibacterium sp.]